VVADPATERMTNNGKVIGFSEKNGSHAWLGIPYAIPPVGALRWKAPLPAGRHTETLQALQTGSFCSQIGNPSIPVKDDLMGQPVGSEDCLFLNIWAPRLTLDQIRQGDVRLPVMFWIHGGGNSIGHGGNYPGRTLAVRHNLIVVTINYRLGPLGWFSHPALRSGETTVEDQSGNYGTLDIIQALSWVRDNIAGFGGDPGNVTVFGESAGAFNTVSLLLASKAKGLFHKAIVQSGGIRLSSLSRAQNFRDDPEPGHRNSSKEVVSQLLLADGQVQNREDARKMQQQMSDQALNTYLMSKTAADLISQYDASNFGMLNFPHLIKDGAVLPQGNALDRFRDRATFNTMPLMIGNNRDELKLFMAFDPQYVNRYLKVIIRVKDSQQYASIAGYTSDAWKASGVDRLAAVLSQSQDKPVFAYRFDWDEEPTLLGADLSFLLGAAHMLEIPFVFGEEQAGSDFSRIFNEDNAAGRASLSSSMTSYWAEFAYTGSPGRGREHKLPKWKSWGEAGQNHGATLIFDTPEDKGIRMSTDITPMEAIKTRLVADTAISDQKLLCGLYVRLFGDENQFLSDPSLWNDQEYENLGKEGCRSFPRSAFLE